MDANNEEIHQPNLQLPRMPVLPIIHMKMLFHENIGQISHRLNLKIHQILEKLE